MAVKTAASNGMLVILNPAPAGDLPDEILKLTEIITPNETEAERLTGIPVNSEADAGMVCRQLHGKGIKKVILTRVQTGFTCRTLRIRLNG